MINNAKKTKIMTSTSERFEFSVADDESEQVNVLST